MKTILFAVNRNQYRYFCYLAARFRGPVEVIHARRIRWPSWRALRHLDRTWLVRAVAIKLNELAARNRARTRWSRGFYRLIYAFLALLACLRYWPALADADASLLVVWNGHFFRQSIACAMGQAMGMRCAFFENGLLPGTTTLDGRGVNFANSVPRQANYFTARPVAGHLPRTLVPRAARCPDRFAPSPTALPARYVFVPFQIDHDTQITRFSPWIRHMQQLFAEVTAAFAQADTGLELVFKEHPSATRRYPAIYRSTQAQPNLHLLNGVATQTLIEHAAAVIVVNSTVGLEALLYSKKVIVLGQAFYALDGIARRAADRRQLVDTLRHLDAWRVDRDLVDRFLAYLLNDYAIPGSWKNPDAQHAVAVEERLGSYHGQNPCHIHGIDAVAPV